MKRKLRFGCNVGIPESVAEWQSLARKVEDLGYSVLLVGDHFGRQWSPLLALAAAAQATSRLRFGTQVIANDFRTPTVFAKEVATLDLLTEGRFELGMGVGHPASSPSGRSDYKQLGMEMDEPGPRVTRLSESLSILKSFFTSSEPFSFSGRFYKVENVVPFPKPAQRPWPTLMVAGAGPRMLKLAAREADIVNIAPRPPTVGQTSRGTVGFGLTIKDELAIIKEAAASRYDDIELALFADRTLVTDKPDEEKDKLAGDLGINRQQLEEMPHTLIGDSDAIARQILWNREQHDISYYIVPAVQINAWRQS